jgi:predicted transcriptional regulator of viral defense system
MKFNDLRLKFIDNGLFSLEDIFKYFPQAHRATVKNQLREWTTKGYLLRLKRNFYCLKESFPKEEFFLANRLDEPSYVSLESALNIYGMIPDIPFAVTSVALNKTKEFKTDFGLFIYRNIKPEFFFGWQETATKEEGVFYKIAKPPKAVFDYLWLNQKSFGKNFPQEERLSLRKDFDWAEFKKYTSLVKGKKFQSLIKKLENYHD